MKKILFFLFLIPIAGVSQNKKILIANVNQLKDDSAKLTMEVIKNLERIESLESIINSINEEKTSLRNSNNDLKVNIDKLKKQKIKKESQIKLKDEEIKNFKHKIDYLSSLTHILDSSLNKYKWNYGEEEFYSSNIGYFEKYSNNHKLISGLDGKNFLKFKTYPIPKKGQDVLEWLKQFEVQNEINIVYDYDVDPDDWKGVSSYSLSIYKNGITVHEYLSYESVSIKIEIPFLSKNDAKIIFEELNLFNLARGCMDDFTLQFEHNNKTFVTSVYFQNGC